MPRQNGSDIPLHVTYKNVVDGVANDPDNCTYGQCKKARELGMS